MYGGRVGVSLMDASGVWGTCWCFVGGRLQCMGDVLVFCRGTPPVYGERVGVSWRDTL